MIWPNWWGDVIRWNKKPYSQDAHRRSSKKFKIHVGSCSHGTAWQFKINTKNWSYYIVLRSPIQW